MLTTDPRQMLVYESDYQFRSPFSDRLLRVTLPWISILRLGPDAPTPGPLRQVVRKRMSKPRSGPTGPRHSFRLKHSKANY
jgi:hypothetical protein